MRILSALIIVISYWLLDSYQDAINFKITFLQAISLDFKEDISFIKILTAIFLFAVSYIVILMTSKANNTSKSKTSYSENMINTLFKVSDTILSPLPLDKQLNSIVSDLENNMNFKSCIISNFSGENIYVLNSNESLKNLGIKTQYSPKNINITSQDIDKLISDTYLEKKDFQEDIISINNIQYRVIVHLYKDSINKPIGIFCAFINPSDTTDYNQFISKICNKIAYTIKFIKKKEVTFKAQNIFNDKFALNDKELGIPTNIKLQDLLAKEIARAGRYGSKLSWIIIEVDYLKNLKNILSDDDLLKVQKEVSNLFKKGVRNTDLFGKWDDNKFAIVAANIDFREAKSFAEKLNRNLAAHRFNKIGKITCSYGITSYYQKDTVETLRKRAQSALDNAIKNGGNSIEIKIVA